MIKILTRLTLCVALFYSFNSAAYNQAMCILIKQEMQQHSNNKTGRSYRNAARDYNKNCNKPVVTPTQSKPKPHAIVNDPEPQKALPEPITEPVKAPIVEPLKTHSETDNTASINTELQASPSQKSQVTTDEPVANVKSSDIKSTDIKNPAAKSTQTNTTEISAEPIAAAQKPANIKPTPVSKPNTESAASLLLPSLLLLLIVLIGVMVLVRMRRSKQSNSEVATVLPTSPAVTTPAPKSVVKSAAKPSPSAVNTQNTTTAQIAAESVSMQQIDAALAKPQASTSEPETVAKTTNTTFSNEKPKTKTKAEPNTAEFEAAAKNTLERIKNASDFAEPEVRMFDPDAPLPTKKQRQQQVTQQAPAAINDQTPAQNAIEPANISPEPIIAQQPTTNIHPPVNSTTEQATSFNTEHEFKEPEVRTFDPDAPLPGSKAKPVIKADTNQQPEPVAEPKEQNVQIDNSNPFANLSLDDSWDPNSSVKPKIAEKKREPKSQALIEAEQRAKNMQTKE
ncbi:cell surface protein [Pseudoalteromonas sp. SCQQ13]|uniref:cell surface protein n=1 Tax=Pseudoalteromonas sp. SCQQ13 TaxID=2792066 RepID=UPI0018CCFDD9|nr:cell surface protein [Pseudoalteromonas sp. SCQQ13]MBH0092184.1 cell surface protein [Pseudoalteromonas sp. SCQQ13]